MLLLGVIAAGDCRGSVNATQVLAVDLLWHLKDADRRPSGAAFEMTEHTAGGLSRATLIVPAESRVTFTLPLPRRAHLGVHVAVPGSRREASVAFRIGISDGRVYRTLVESTITSGDTAVRGWVRVVADLGPFAGQRFSLFFRPDSRRWQVILGTHVVSGDPAVVYLGEPAIETDSEAAREYMKRQSRQQ